MRMRGIMRNILIAAVLLGIGFYITNSSNKVKPVAGKIDENNIFSAADHYFMAMDAYNEASIQNFCKKLGQIQDSYLKDQMNVYYSMIPDKSYFTINPAFSEEDYLKLADTVLKSTKDMEYIPIFDRLNLSDYFKTDHHWRQEKIFPVVETLGKAMGFKVNEKDFKENILKNYHGVYSPYIEEADQVREDLVYLTGPFTEHAAVDLFEVDFDKIYNLEKWDSKVPYDLFLSGPNPLIQIKNPLYEGKRELIIFGDSFANSLAPLLIPAYSNITLVDLRFIASSILGDFITFNDQDILFLYNTTIINRSFMLK